MNTEIFIKFKTREFTAMALKTTLTFFIASIFSGLSYSQNYYLDPKTGSFNGDGSRESPWPSLQSVIEHNMIKSQSWKAPYDWGSEDHPLIEKNPEGKIKSGDQLLLLPGYHGDILLFDYINESDIKITSATDEQAVVGTISVRASKNWVFQNLTVNFSYSRPDIIRKSTCGYETNSKHKWASYDYKNNQRTSGSDDPRSIVNIYSHGWRGPSSNIQLDNNRITSHEEISDWNVPEWCIYARSGIHMGATRSKITNNTIKNIKFGISVTSDWNQVSNNKIVNFTGDALRGIANHLIFENNLIANALDVDDNHDDGFQSWVVKRRTEVQNIILRGNKFFNDLNHPGKAKGIISDFQGIGMFDGPYDHILIENNLLYINHWHAITLMGGTFSIIRNNTVIDSTPEDEKPPWITISATKNNERGRDNAIYNNLGYVKPNSNAEIMANNAYISPNKYEEFFTNIRTHDFSLKPMAPTINSGTHIPGIPALITDINGKFRTEIPDIGAYEYQQVNSHPLCKSGQKHNREYHRCVVNPDND